MSTVADWSEGCVHDLAYSDHFFAEPAALWKRASRRWSLPISQRQAYRGRGRHPRRVARPIRAFRGVDNAAAAPTGYSRCRIGACRADARLRHAYGAACRVAATSAVSLPSGFMPIAF